MHLFFAFFSAQQRIQAVAVRGQKQESRAFSIEAANRVNTSPCAHPAKKAGL
jgi:hypothetical protein